MNSVFRTTMLFYRKSADDETHVYNDDPKSGDVYHEFEETWERPRCDEDFGTADYEQRVKSQRRRLTQVSTCKKFHYVDRITSEFAEDRLSHDHEDILKGYLVLTKPEDFSYLRLKQI